MSQVVVLARRVVRHLTRTTAYTAWSVFVLCLLAYAAVPYGPVDQFAVVLAGVAAGAIFLPELNGRLWHMRAEDIRQTIPQPQVERLHRELIASQVQVEGWTDYVYDQGLHPLIQAGTDSRAVYRNVSYNVDVRLRQDVGTASGAVVMNRVRTELGAERLLPEGQPELCVSVARNSEALAREFTNPACIGRELVSLPSIVGDASDSVWQDAVLETCRVMVGIDHPPVRLVEPERDGPVLRWRLPAPQIEPGRRVRVTVVTEFLDETSTRSFPVIFGHYYCVDATHITFSLEKNRCTTALHAVEFFARGLDCPAGSLQQYSDGDRETVRYVSPSGSLLWPGSGLLLHWDVEQPPHEVAPPQRARPRPRTGAAGAAGRRASAAGRAGDAGT